MWRNSSIFSRRTIPLPRRPRFFAALLALFATVAAALLFATSDGGQRAFATPVCENGTIIPNHADNPQLVGDCTVLLDLQPTLAGTATLNWGANTALTSWNGITVGSLDGIQRVTELDMDGQGLNGTIPAQLGELTGLRELRLAWGNQLTGSIPAELGRLTSLTFLNLAANHLSGSIPPELGSIGPQLTHLVLSAPQPLPDGVGLTGSIPAQLGNLSGLTSLYLDGNRLTGSIPPRLGRLLKLSWLNLTRNQLTGAIPTQLGELTNLTNLRLEDNQLSGPIPSQLSRLTNLRKVYLTRNTGFSGCVPPRLREVRFNDIATLNLPDCASDAPETPETPLPAYTLTVTAGEGGAVDPPGVSIHTEAVPVILTASWNDATHTFSGWSGACTGSATTCTLELYADATVSAAFTPLPTDRCATPTDPTCIRAVYLGAPDDYAQVQDIPAELLVSPDDDGRYQVKRGHQITVVTAAPLPTGWSRLYLERAPDQDLISPTSYMQLIPPVGTTYTFTPTAHEGGANLLTFDLHAARPLPVQRPGIKPELGDIVVTTQFLVPSLRYNRLDTTGTASTPGSYAFLRTSSDPLTAIPNFGTWVLGAVVLRINATDATGIDRSAVFNAMSIGDKFDFQTNGIDCGFRFEITQLPSPTNPRTIGIKPIGVGYGGWCEGPIDNPTSPRNVHFVWRVPPGLPTADPSPNTIPILIYDEPVGAGTYQVAQDVPLVIQVLEGHHIIFGGVYISEQEYGQDGPSHGFYLHHVESGSVLHIDPDSGRETRRIIIHPGGVEAAALFDHIISTIRRIP